MREVTIANVTLQLEAGEAGGRYRHPILILPGLFHSFRCWHGMTAMLAHRGWDVYVLARDQRESAAAAGRGSEYGWQTAVAEATTAIRELDDEVIVLGADLGASLALAALEEARPMAMALFSPSTPAELGARYRQSLGVLARMRASGDGDHVTAPRSLARRAHDSRAVGAEPRRLIEDLVAGVAFEPSREHPPAIVFPPSEDPLVEPDHALEFASTEYAEPSRTGLAGRWWPAQGWTQACDEVHRFLILTLSDRVVEFPAEIIGE